jgi:hypothetical protein
MIIIVLKFYIIFSSILITSNLKTQNCKIIILMGATTLL